MIRNIANFKNWIGGVCLAFAGAALARLPISSPEAALWTMTIGRLLAIGGLAWIAISVSRRVRRDSEDS